MSNNLFHKMNRVIKNNVAKNELIDNLYCDIIFLLIKMKEVTS